jgi:putative DNA primase/helicase
VLSEYARRLVNESSFVGAEDPAGCYFRSRLCKLPSGQVRFHPGVWHPQERRSYPAIVSLVTDVITGQPISLHITYLNPDGGGKAKIACPRLYLAGHRKAGGVIRVHADDEVTMGLIIGEGLETCLTYALEFSPIWACLDAGNLRKFPVIPALSGISVLIDNDDAGRHAFEAVRNRYEAAGIEVMGIRCESKPGADVNDEVQHGG